MPTGLNFFSWFNCPACVAAGGVSWLRSAVVFFAGELQEVWKQAEYFTLRKENTQCITNVPDTQARFLPAQVEVSEVYFYTF